MKKYLGMFILTFALIFLAVFSGCPCWSAEQLTIVGVVNEDRQMMDENDRVYVIGDNKMGQQLRLQVEKRLRVSGNIETMDNETVLMVTTYEILED